MAAAAPAKKKPEGIRIEPRPLPLQQTDEGYSI